MFHIKIKQKEEQGNCAKKRREMHYVQTEMRQDFFDAICSTLNECVYLPNYKQYGNDNFLLFHTYDDEYLTIGCVKGNNYLLDSTFIYKRFDKLFGKNPLLCKADFYTKLFHLEVLKPYLHFQNKPLFKLKIDNAQRRYFFCISNDILKFDLSTLKAY